MDMNSKALRYDMLQVIANHPYDSSVRDAINELAELIQLKLKPGKFEVEGYLYALPDQKNIALWATEDGKKIVDMYAKSQEAFGDIFAGTKVRVTVEEVID